MTLAALDQTARSIVAEQAINQDDYFLSRIANIDFSRMNKLGQYAACEEKSIKWGYKIKTCFDAQSGRLQKSRGKIIEVRSMHYWGPRSHLTSQFPRWWYYEIGNTSRTIFIVTSENKIYERFINE